MNPPKFTACKLLLILVLLAYCNCRGIDDSDYNNNYVMCGNKDNIKLESCPNGGRAYETICGYRNFCYRGLLEKCNANVEMQCAPGFTCRCGFCQNCDENNCFIELCPSYHWFKRFENNLALDPATRFAKNLPLDPITDMVAYLHN